MINLNNVIKFCPNNYTEIENYDKAINDNSQMWYCHHRNGEEFNIIVYKGVNLYV